MTPKPPTPVQVLLGILRDPESVARIHTRLNGIHPAFEEFGACAFTWYALWLANLPPLPLEPIPYDPIPARFASLLVRAGWHFRPATDNPRAGDVFVTGDAEDIKGVGIVVSTHLRAARDGGKFETIRDWFLAADQTLAPSYAPYRRSYENDGERGEVKGWLRFG